MKRLVWSFWSKPFYEFYHRQWGEERNNWFAWVISVLNAKKWHPELELHLVTDDIGKRILVDHLQLPFDEVSLSLNKLADTHTKWWVAGKLQAYAEQTKPFIHIDNDVFLWKALPDRILNAPIIGQNPERFDFHDDWLYRPTHYMILCDTHNGWFPSALRAFCEQEGNVAINCGVVGGNDIELFQQYTTESLRWIQHPANEEIWHQEEIDIRSNIIAEQYMLAASITAKYDTLLPHVQYLFETIQDSYDEAQSEVLGYSHIIGDAKRNPAIHRRLMKRIISNYPTYYLTILELRSENFRE